MDVKKNKDLVLVLLNLYKMMRLSLLYAKRTVEESRRIDCIYVYVDYKSIY